MRHPPALVRLAALAGFEVGAVVGLHRLGDMPWLSIDPAGWGAWLDASRPEDVVMTLLRLAALGLAYWLAASTALYAGARLAGAVRLASRLEWTTPPVVRRVVDRAVAVSLAVATATSPVVAVAHPAQPPLAGEEQSLPAVGGGPRPAFLLGPGVEWAEPLPPDGAAPDHPGLAEDGRADPRPVEQADNHVVAAGDSLWSIATATLAATDPAADQETLARYWWRVVEGNRTRLRSGDPDLIYPGETILLPPP